jgi:hypothetical protein
LFPYGFIFLSGPAASGRSPRAWRRALAHETAPDHAGVFRWLIFHDFARGHLSEEFELISTHWL